MSGIEEKFKEESNKQAQKVKAQLKRLSEIKGIKIVLEGLEQGYTGEERRAGVSRVGSESIGEIKEEISKIKDGLAAVNDSKLMEY